MNKIKEKVFNKIEKIDKKFWNNNTPSIVYKTINLTLTQVRKEVEKWYNKDRIDKRDGFNVAIGDEDIKKLLNKLGGGEDEK
ncbi:unnamed protein product [marine sediment metagenome]|uniref:Uncharacterized protein n=1 Tax=marine sediment metagenome TaxID=412755 RepID=X1JIE8_9ZZZZ